MPWAPHPEGGTDRTPTTVVPDAGERRVVRLGAVGDLGQGRHDDPRQLSLSICEFAVLDDGRRLILHCERGFTAATNAEDIWAHQTVESITGDVLTVVLPDDAEQTGEAHPWDWLAGLLRARGLDVSTSELRELPYDVVLMDRVLDRLPRRP